VRAHLHRSTASTLCAAPYSKREQKRLVLLCMAILSVLARSLARKRTHMPSQTHNHAHTHTHARAHSRIRVLRPCSPPSFRPVHPHNTLARTSASKYERAHTHARARTYARTRAHIRTHARMHTRANARTYTWKVPSAGKAEITDEPTSPASARATAAAPQPPLSVQHHIVRESKIV
jgi:hypothetical protein